VSAITKTIRTGLILMAVAGLLLPGCSEETTGQPTSGSQRVPTMILVTVDGLPRDYYESFGGSKPSTAIDRIKAVGGIAADAVTASPMSAPAVASILTGRGLDRHGVLDDPGPPLDAGVPLVAEALREAGYMTGAFPTSPFLRKSKGLTRGFEILDDPSSPPLNPSERVLYPVEASATLEPALAWLRTVDPASSLFAWLHFPGAAAAGEAILGEQGMTTRDTYFAGLDEALGSLLDTLSAAGRLDEAEIHLIGTYGEVWPAEQGVIGPGFSSGDAAIRVPYVFKPGRGRTAPEAGIRVWGPDVGMSLAAAGGVTLDGAEGIDIAGRGPGDRTLFTWSAAPRDQMGWIPWVAAQDPDRKVVVGWGATPDVPEIDSLRQAAEQRADLPALRVSMESSTKLLEGQGLAIEPVSIEARDCGPDDPCAEALPLVWSARYIWFVNDRRGAAHKYRAALENDPDNLAALVEWGFTAAHELPRGQEKTRRAATLYPQNPYVLHWVGHTYHKSDPEVAKEFWLAVEPTIPWHPDLLYDLACNKSLAGEIESSIDYLRRSLDNGFDYWDLLQTDPDLRNLRADPRFATLMKELGR
jgi:hypothetical protein